ncbi:MAG: hypothetical protein EOS81_14915 [Mesorhizobium sp.]|nr:hypothetical protein EJ072_15260 [Mesorhizobium sp. M2A.F.Ca.ET.046.03.2.1]RVC69355.1 hypothetical protein EN759_08270 [Mesorhizobium sp. M00.F.Ca.ET.038.03.1.1]RVC73173.1 hypothetical protein EN766_21570 [Mesorhizobium sp. M2A.F.Ca.ET.046.02.1.1]RWB37019.1 MAG: hypothetical protein EOQ44_34495 [Mesorhizobium sp.]RWE04891.1 MAG: hypothetical protein EOS76_33350 [Mesorhizobium sp.]
MLTAKRGSFHVIRSRNMPGRCGPSEDASPQPRRRGKPDHQRDLATGAGCTHRHRSDNPAIRLRHRVGVSELKPTGGQKRPGDVIGDAVHVMRIATGGEADDTLDDGKRGPYEKRVTCA